MKGLNLDWLYEEINMGGCGCVERGVYNKREWGSMYVYGCVGSVGCVRKVCGIGVRECG